MAYTQMISASFLNTVNISIIHRARTPLPPPVYGLPYFAPAPLVFQKKTVSAILEAFCGGGGADTTAHIPKYVNVWDARVCNYRKINCNTIFKLRTGGQAVKLTLSVDLSIIVIVLLN